MWKLPNFLFELGIWNNRIVRTVYVTRLPLIRIKTNQTAGKDCETRTICQT